MHNRNLTQRRHRPLARFEPLESRRLLAGDPIINEFLASNRDVLDDGNGNSSDWIEIRNAGDAPVDLQGWYLTDDPDRLTRWQFPDQPTSELDPGEYLVVFASGDGEADQAGNLHTNFRLSRGGEYIALVMPDGRTVQSEFGPDRTEYPEQITDVSYGIGQESLSQVLVDTGSPAHVLIPDADSDGQFGTSWQGGDEPAFADAGGVGDWIDGNLGLGYGTSAELTPLIETDLGESMSGVNSSAYIRVPFTVSDAAEINSLRLRMQYDDGFIAYVNGTKVAFGNAREEVTWNSRASDTHDGKDEETFVLPVDVLVEGQNILALHGLNRTRASSDFFILPQLTAEFQTGVTTLGYMANPTPGAPNSHAKLGIVGVPQTDIERGFFDAPFDVTVSVENPGASIVYTTDGSRPTLTNGEQIPAPDANSPPTTQLRIAATTTLRMAAFKDDFHASRVNTQSYIFIDDVINQRDMDPDIVSDPAYRDSIHEDLKSIPTMSLVVNNDDFFGRGGIYSSPSQTGRESERPLSIEYFDPASDAEFQIDAGIRIHGADARNHQKKPLRLLFRSEYGETKLRYPLFPESPVDEFDKLILRGGGHEGFTSPWGVQPESATFLRDQFQRDTQRLMGQLSAHGTFVHVYINGRYWGLYNLHERPDADFQASYRGGETDDYDVISTDGSVVDGDKRRWNEAQSLANRGLKSDAAYTEFQQLVDIDSLIDEMILRIWASDIDWLRSQRELASTGNRNKNWYAATDRNDGQFKFFVWDAELSMGKNHRSNRNLFLNLTDVDIRDSPGRFYAKLKENSDFRLRFGDRLHKHFFNGGVLVPEQAASRWNALADHIRQAVVPESARWGDAVRRTPLTRDETWQSEVEWVANSFIPRRHDIVLEQFRDIGLYPRVEAPVFNQHGGSFAGKFDLSMSAQAGTIYYTTDNVDPRDGATNAPSDSALVYSSSISLTESTTIKARVWDGDSWSALNHADFVATSDLPGDANRDGVFNSSDLVLVFQAGEYEDDLDDNSRWEEGDWDGDGDFTTSDLVLAFRAGHYSNAAAQSIRPQTRIAAMDDARSGRRSRQLIDIVQATESLFQQDYETLAPGRGLDEDSFEFINETQ